MSDLNLALIGNSTIGALVNARADVVWSCMPRLDSSAVFDSLVRGNDRDDPTGVFRIQMMNFSHAEQAYQKNTAVLVTRLFSTDGDAIQVTDFCPRFKQFGRMYRPVMLVRKIEPVSGTPRIRVVLRPQARHGTERVQVTYGSNHIRYVMPDVVLRLTTDISITAVLDEVPVVIDGPVTMILGPDETCTESVAQMGRRFHEETAGYWSEWVRYLGIPFEWQNEVIRAAITLKLNAYDDTGAIIAAVTSSIPEAPNSGRNWDYRYCWLRDAYFVVAALSRLGATQTMERYIRYIINRITESPGGRLQPVYRINGERNIDETIIESLAGFNGMGPVRMGNAAYEQVQNDVYGAAILAAAHVFYDERLRHPGSESLYAQLELLGERAAELYDKPDAGLWEYRGIAKVHTFSAVMCWAACDRLAKIGNRMQWTKQERRWRAKADEIRGVILEHAWNEDLGTFVDSFDGSDLDASLLLVHQLGFIAADDLRFAGTVAAVEKTLKRGDFIMRYAKNDDFGMPETAFVVCTFWYIDALHAMGRTDEARKLFENMLAHCNSHGLLSEDIDMKSRTLWGNFPQTYSMVGLINCALRLSRPWEGEF